MAKMYDVDSSHLLEQHEYCLQYEHQIQYLSPGLIMASNSTASTNRSACTPVFADDYHLQGQLNTPATESPAALCLLKHHPVSLCEQSPTLHCHTLGGSFDYGSVNHWYSWPDHNVDEHAVHNSLVMEDDMTDIADLALEALSNQPTTNVLKFPQREGSSGSCAATNLNPRSGEDRMSIRSLLLPYLQESTPDVLALSSAYHSQLPPPALPMPVQLASIHHSSFFDAGELDVKYVTVPNTVTSYPPLPELSCDADLDSTIFKNLGQPADPIWQGSYEQQGLVHEPETNAYMDGNQQPADIASYQYPSRESQYEPLHQDISATENSEVVRGGNTRSTSKDDLLVKYKDAGMSYREIKIRFGFKEVESTLRGRYRTLTKRKEQRVRKPKWSERDINILTEIVNRYVRDIMDGNSDGHDARCSGPRCEAILRRDALRQVPWSHVADRMASRGCYRFGNGAVKKKYMEVTGLPYEPRS